MNPIFAKDPDWYIKKDSWIETYLESINAICAAEASQGNALVSNKNDGKLPVVTFSTTKWQLGEMSFQVDITGVDKRLLQFRRVVSNDDDSDSGFFVICYVILQLPELRSTEGSPVDRAHG